MDFLILGSAGFIGHHLLEKLLYNGYNVIAVYNRTKPIISSNYSSQLSLCHVDNLSNFLSNDNFQPSVCFDFAWAGTSGYLRSDFNIQMSNITNCINAVKLCHDYHMRYVGSGSVMENESIISTFNDQSTPGYSNYYSYFKFLSHAITKSVANELNVDYLWGQITNSYGPGESSNRIICSTLTKLIQGIIPEFSSGSQWYDFIYIDDLVDAFLAIALSGKSNTNYVLGSGSPRHLKDYLIEINQLLMPTKSFMYGSDPDICKMLCYSDYDTSKLKEDTGFKPKVSFEEGIIKTHEYLVSNMVSF